MALRSTPRLSTVPASQNTAPVNEYRCLFTSDLRRKQKRWQDGYLKFHTFNSRVMVYDTSRNFLGDTYWKEPNELHEGDELTLDKGIMVEVAEAMGVTQTDLTPLLERKKESPQRNNPGPVQRALPKPAVPATNALRAGSQLRHKSLNALLGTPRGPIGKATPMRSPFETRKEKENQFADERASKRQKTGHSGVEQMTSSPTAESEPTPNEKVPLWAKTSDAKHIRAAPRPLSRPVAVVTLVSEPDSISSDVTLPSTPPGMVKPVSRLKVAPVSTSNQGVARGPQAFATPKIPKGKVPVPHVKALETPHAPPQPSSPPISASNRLSNVDFALQPAHNRSTNADVAIESMQCRPAELNLTTVQTVHKPPEELPLPRSPLRNPKAKSLRLSVGVKRSVLLCQSRPPQRSHASIEPKCIPKPMETVGHESLREEIIHILSDDETTQQSKPSKPGKVASELIKTRTAQSASVANEPKPINVEPSFQPSLEFFDDMEFIHGLMDQQLMVTPSPPRSREPTKTATKPSVKKSPKKGKRAPEDTPAKLAPKPKKAKTATTKEGGAKPRSKKKQSEKPQLIQQESPPASPVREPTEELSGNQAMPPTESADERQRTAPASMSPNKSLALSTGGFRKKPKRAQPQPTTKPDDPAPRPVTAALSPHPLRAGKSGPLMSTTELSALLLKPHKPARLEDDPIEDGTQDASPHRSFQRSRSENDAPIPSTSEAWEQRNLPKAFESTASVHLAVMPEAALPKPKAGGLAALVKKTDPRRKFQRTQSLNVNTNVPNIAEVDVVTPPADHDVGPWSTEAFDLFDWRPPDMEGGIGTLVDS